jgi:hypothetical protein
MSPQMKGATTMKENNPRPGDAREAIEKAWSTEGIF